MKTINEKQSKKLIQEYPFYLISFQGENILENFNNTFKVNKPLSELYYLYTYDSEELLTNKSQQQEILQKLAKLIETFYEESDNQEMIDIYAKFYLPILELKYNIQPN